MPLEISPGERAWKTVCAFRSTDEFEGNDLLILVLRRDVFFDFIRVWDSSVQRNPSNDLSTLCVNM